jgi:hypothetical protein
VNQFHAKLHGKLVQVKENGDTKHMHAKKMTMLVIKLDFVLNMDVMELH